MPIYPWNRTLEGAIECLLRARALPRFNGVRRIMTMLDQSMIVQPQKPAITLSRKDWLFRANRALV